MATIGTASITLTDISDAIIAGSMPASTNPGQLWIDTSGVTNVLKVYKNGQWIIQELDVESMDSHLKETIQTITDTLGTISDDNKLNHADRVMIVDSLADILGVVPSTKTTNKYPAALPDYTVLDANGSGTFASYRSSAIALGIEDTSGEYIELKDAYLALINYLQLLASGNVMPWDITEANKGTILDVDSDQFRQTWLDYYMAEQALVRRILEVPGPAGAPAISGILDNDSVTIPTKADGTGGIYTRASTKMLVYVGDTNDTAKWSFSAAKDPSAGIVGTLTGNLYVVSSMAADTGYVDLTASREGYASVSKRFSLTKAKQGDTVVDYWVETDYPVIVKDRDDVYTPTALTITAHTQTGTELPESFSGIIKIEESNDGKVYTSKYTSTKPESSKVWTPSAGIKSIRIKLLTADGVNQLDYEIVQVVADGKDGADGYSPIYSELTNESMTVTTDVNGENGGYGGAESTIHIYQGQVEVTDQYNISVAISEGSGITGTRTGSTYKVTNMTADSGYVDFIATRSGHLTLTRRFTISKSKTGAAGKPATSRWLTLDTPVIRKMVTGAYFPASITMKAWQATGDQPPTAYTGRFRISINTGGSTYTVNTTTVDVTSHTYSVPENVTGIKIELLSTGGATWLDEETIQVIQDGKDGAPGKDGLSAVVGFLTNESISVQATYNGAVSNYEHVKGTFEVYYGNTRVTGSNVSYSVDTANTSNLTVAIDSVTGAYSVTGITSGTSVTSGAATLKAVYEGVTITKVLTVTKSMAGTNGGNATAYWMITSAGIVSRTLDAVFTPSTITFTGKSKTGTAAPTNYSGRFVVEQTTNGSTWTSLSNTGTNVTSVTVTPTGAAIAVRAKFYLAGGTSVLLDEQTVPIVTDITDEVLDDIKDDIDDKTGTGLWKLDTYMGTTDLIPELKHTRDNTKLVKSDTVKDFTNSTEHTADTDKVYHFYTHLETAAATNIALKVDHTAGIRILVNGGEPIYSSSVSGLAKPVTLTLAQGWNTVDILLRSTTTGAYVKFDKLISESVVKMSSYLGGGVSTSRLLMMQDEISFAVVQGERVAGLTITNDVINGANIEISGDTTFKDDLVMDAGSIKSKDGGVDIDLNAGTVNLSRPLTINYKPVATQQQLDEIDKKYEGQSLLDKTEVLSGTEIFTDKADDSVVHVDIDGKSVGGGSGKNLIKRSTELTIIADSTQAFVFDILRFDTLTEGKRYVFSADVEILAGTLKNGSNVNVSARKSDGSSVINDFIGTTIQNGRIVSSIVASADTDKIYLYAGTAGYTNGNTVKFTNIQLEQKDSGGATTFEPPAPNPDYPVEIHSLFDGYRENLFSADNVIESKMESTTSGGLEAFTNSDVDGIFYPIQGEPNKQYTLTFEYKYIQGTTPIHLKFYYSDGMDDGTIHGSLNSTALTTKSITSDANKTVIGVGYASSNESIEWKSVTTYEVVPFTTVRQDDNTLLIGTEVVETEGVNGSVEVVTEFEYINDVATGNKREVSRVTQTAMVPKVILVGTKQLDVTEWRPVTTYEVISFTTTRQNDDTLLIGTEVVKTQGVNGRIEVVTEHEYINDVATGNKREVSRVIQTDMVPEVILVGTKEEDVPTSDVTFIFEIDKISGEIVFRSEDNTIDFVRNPINIYLESMEVALQATTAYILETDFPGDMWVTNNLYSPTQSKVIDGISNPITTEGIGNFGIVTRPAIDIDGIANQYNATLIENGTYTFMIKKYE